MNNQETYFKPNKHDLLLSESLSELISNIRIMMLGYFGTPIYGEITSRDITIPTSNSIFKNSKYMLREKKSFIHYTSIQVLKSILETKKVRLYRLDTMDDKNEMEFIYNNSNLSKNENEIIAEKRLKYIFSMCDSEIETNLESLEMWRKYGNDGKGVGIEFEIDTSKSDEWIGYMLSKVYYGKENMELFTNAYTKYLELSKKYEVRINNFIEIMHVLFPFHKSMIYKNEKEIRFLYRVLQNMDILSKTDLSSNNELRHYVEINLEQENNERKKILLKNGNKALDTNVIPYIKIKKIYLGYRITANERLNISKTIKDDLKQFKNQPIIEWSPLRDEFVRKS